MSRPAKNIIWQQRDGTYSVTVSERSDRPGRKPERTRWDCGVTLLEVCRLLGHQSITTTERWYAGVGEATLARAIELVQDVRDERAKAPVRRLKAGGG